MTSRQRKILIYAFILGGFLACVADVVLACPKSGAKRTGSLYAQNRSAKRSNTAYAFHAKQGQKPLQTQTAATVIAPADAPTSVATSTPAATPVPSLKPATETNYDELAVEHLLSAYQPAPEISETKPPVKEAAPTNVPLARTAPAGAVVMEN